MPKWIAWLDARLPVLTLWKSHFTEYYVPKNLNFLYLFGAFALVLLVNQFVSGLWLTMFYTPTAKDAFASIQAIMREVNYGWLLRYLHSTGASFFFLVIYIHIFKALLYGSYQKPRELVWLLGMGLYALLMMEAFFGYVLPWGQLSYWAATVITDLFSALPLIGDRLVLLVRGGFSVGNPTLHRFFALHIIAIPLLLLFFLYLHLAAVRRVGSNNPEGIVVDKADKLPFFPYFLLKDGVAIVAFLMVFSAVVFFAPDAGGLFLEPENFVEANPLTTPQDMIPVWYLSPFYAILRAIPNKLLGIFLMFGALFMFLFLPWLDKAPVKSMRYKGHYSRTAFGLFIVSVLLLGYLGRASLTPLHIGLTKVSVIFYFAYFLLMPVYTRYEKCKKPDAQLGEG